MPDLEVTTAGGSQRVFTFMHDARPVLLNLAAPRAFDVTPWTDRVKVIDARYEGAWELPAIGVVAAPRAVLIRPDGHVAWVDADSSRERASHAALNTALTTWFGPRILH